MRYFMPAQIGFVFSNTLFLKKRALSIVEGSKSHKGTKPQSSKDMGVIARHEVPWQSLSQVDGLAPFDFAQDKLELALFFCRIKA
jgi:hypothetical protein